MNVERTVRLNWLCLFVLSVVLLSQPAVVKAIDIFRTDLAVPPEPSGAMLEGLEKRDACEFEALGTTLELGEALERALCNNPKTREAWTSIKVQTAAVGIAKAPFLPTLTGSWQKTRNDNATTVEGFPTLSSQQKATERAYSASLNWILYDFGARGAALENAEQLLAAAQANHDQVLQETFMNVAKDFYAAQAAFGSLAASTDIENISKQSLAAASGRVDKGIAPISDQLQAQTVYAQAVFSRTKAHGDWLIAVGALMSDMDLDPRADIRLPDIEEMIMPVSDFARSLDELIAQAKEDHPSVRTALAQWKAALAKADQAKAEGLPNVSMIGKYSWNNQPVSPSIGQPGLPAWASEKYIGIQVNVPIFDGFNRTYQVRQAQAQAELAKVTLEEVQRKVASTVWSSEQALRTATENIGNSASLLDIAQRSYDAALHRYLSGVGNVIELLSTQSALATAHKQRVQALADWRTARLQLAAALGRIGMQSLRAGE
ncbi:TolC family protein [Herbaspirillum huttiense]|uniref:TolC family protein n=1 Tax=Herbaspirillum huttiense TaxID=863372 RepID=UPI0021769958|nr:TolC family protein [Herbaspirillum huttiense]UWE16096.1 TolC family protein [Herbaspirillum huttiense]